MSTDPIAPPSAHDVIRLIDWALREDGDGCDVTSELLVAGDEPGSYALVARQAGVFAGLTVLHAFAQQFADQHLAARPNVADGQAIAPGQVLATLTGPCRTVLQIERPLLNFLQRLCGVATLTRRYVEAVAGTPARILDTRKTIPGWRQLDKYAVRCGGGMNHRFGLHDAVLVKDNHLAGVPIGELRELVADLVVRARRRKPAPDFVEVEVDSIDQLREVLAAGGVDRVLLDNFSLEQMREAVAMRDASPGDPVKQEASGRIELETVRAVAETGVDFISVGALTHSVASLDLAIEVKPA